MHSIQTCHPEADVYIYCSASSTVTDLVHAAKSRFNLDILPNFSVVPLRKRHLLDPSRYPRLTMVCQAIASVIVAVEALDGLVPQVWIDTTGWAFPYPLIRMLGSHVIAYVHYPTISSDMLLRVKNREAAFNNSNSLASSGIFSYLKLVYYHIFAFIYGFCGGFANVCMVNSSWTKSHIEDIWWMHGGTESIALVYPPCDTEDLRKLDLDKRLKTITVLSIAQFRPEKNHEIQLQALAHARNAARHMQDAELAELVMQTKLILAGGCRGDKDYERVDMLKHKAKELGLDDSCVEFCINVPFSDLRTMLGNAIAGIHSMRDEHFGISVVEYMAAGAIPIAHASGGPQTDIVKPEPVDGEMQETGYLCDSVEQYSRALTEVLRMDTHARLAMSGAARRRSSRFSDERFQHDFLEAVMPLLAADGILPTNKSKRI